MAFNSADDLISPPEALNSGAFILVILFIDV